MWCNLNTCIAYQMLFCSEDMKFSYIYIYIYIYVYHIQKHNNKLTVGNNTEGGCVFL